MIIYNWRLALAINGHYVKDMNGWRCCLWASRWSVTGPVRTSTKGLYYVTDPKRKRFRCCLHVTSLYIYCCFVRAFFSFPFLSSSPLDSCIKTYQLTKIPLRASNGSSLFNWVRDTFRVTGETCYGPGTSIILRISVLPKMQVFFSWVLTEKQGKRGFFFTCSKPVGR